MKAIESCLDKYPQLFHSRFSKSFNLKILKRVLKNNHFAFNEELFLQTTGTAMGTIFAPTYPELVAEHFEIEFYGKH